MPNGMTAKQAAQYVREAIRRWREGLDVDDPLFGLNPERLTVKSDEKGVTTCYMPAKITIHSLVKTHRAEFRPMSRCSF